MGREKTILSQNGKKKNSKKKVWSSIEPSTVKSYSSASGRFSHSGSHIVAKWPKLHVSDMIVQLIRIHRCGGR